MSGVNLIYFIPLFFVNVLRPFWEFIHWWNWRLNLLCTESTYSIVIDTPSWLSCVCSVYVLLSRRLPPTTRELWLTPGHNWPSHQSISLTNLSSQPFRSRHKRRFYVKIDLYQDISNNEALNLFWRPRVCCHFLFGKETINVCVLTIINVLICSYFIFTLISNLYCNCE